MLIELESVYAMRVSCYNLDADLNADLDADLDADLNADLDADGPSYQLFPRPKSKSKLCHLQFLQKDWAWTATAVIVATNC